MNRSALGPSVTWKPAAQAPPRITAVYGQFLAGKAPFVLVPTSSMQQNLPAQAFVQGMNLGEATWKIGAMTVGGTTTGPGTPSNGTFAILFIPANASSGTVCASSTISTGCSPTPLQIFGGPVISRTPTIPLALRTNHTIEGLNLAPPSTIVGLRYKWQAIGGFLDSTATASTDLVCNTVLQVLEHTANRIVFRIGDPGRTAPLPVHCATSELFTPSPRLIMVLNATLDGVPGAWSLLKPFPFYLKP